MCGGSRLGNFSSAPLPSILTMGSTMTASISAPPLICLNSGDKAVIGMQRAATGVPSGASQVWCVAPSSEQAGGRLARRSLAIDILSYWRGPAE